LREIYRAEKESKIERNIDITLREINRDETGSKTERKIHIEND
jgi:hypothetical protein